MRKANELPSEPDYGTEVAMGQRKKSVKPLFGLDDAPLSGILGINSEELEAEFHKAEKSRKTFWEEFERAQPWIRECRDRAISGILGDENVKESYFNLLNAGFSQPEFLQMLVGMAVSMPRKGKTPKWLSGLGMSPKRLDYFAGQLNAIADEIEKLNKYPYLAPDPWIQGRKLSDSEKKYYALRFTQLPFLLRCYAAYTKGHSKDMRHFFREKTRRSPRADLVRALIMIVRRETGRPMYGDLSIILAAAARKAGLADSDCNFDAPTLKMLDIRMQRKQKHPPSP